MLCQSYTFCVASGQNEHLILRSGCVYPGYNLIYECTVKGGAGGATVWQGTAFDCLSNEITLLHSRFTSLGSEAFGVCNNGAIEGKSIGVKNSCYTSQLTINKLNTNMIGESIVCIYDDMTELEIGSERIITTTGYFFEFNDYIVNCYQESIIKWGRGGGTHS